MKSESQNIDTPPNHQKLQIMVNCGASLMQPIEDVAPPKMVISASRHGASAVTVDCWSTFLEKPTFCTYFGIHRYSSVLLGSWGYGHFNTGGLVFLLLKLCGCTEKSEREPMYRNAKPKRGLTVHPSFDSSTFSTVGNIFLTLGFSCNILCCQKSHFISKFLVLNLLELARMSQKTDEYWPLGLPLINLVLSKVNRICVLHIIYQRCHFSHCECLDFGSLHKPSQNPAIEEPLFSAAYIP